MKNRDELIKTLCSTGPFPPQPATVEQWLDSGEIVEYSAKTPIVKEGSEDSNIYMILDGLARLAYFNGQTEVTYGFGDKGTFFISPKGFFGMGSAIYTVIAVSKVKMLRVSKEKFMELVNSSYDMAKFFLNISFIQFVSSELKAEFMRGTAEERLDALESSEIFKQMLDCDPHHPDVTKDVPSKVLASYLGITQSYLSNIRKARLKGKN